MHSAGNRFSVVFAAPVALLAMASSLYALPPGKPVAKPSATHKIIMVHEGTNLAVTASPDRKTILMDLQGMVYTVPFAGGHASRVTGPLVEASHPEFSPDGTQVVIQSYAGGTFHIWLMKPDGTALHQITFGHGDDREPRFSPDGKSIAFTSDRAFSGSYNIWTVDVATGALKQITNFTNDEYGPAWAADGKSIAYVNGVFVAGAPGVGGVTGRSIESIELATHAVKEVATIGKAAGRLEAPSYSPDGKHLAYIQFFGNGMFTDTARLVVDGTPVTDTPGVSANDAFPFAPVWLSNSTLLYTANGHIVQADLTAKTQSTISFNAGIDSMRPVYKTKNYDFNAHTPRQALGIFSPALSPDGKSIAFIALNQLYLLTIGTPTPKALTRDTFYKQGPAWSPDGKTLAYVSDKDGTENVYLLDIATGAEKHPAPTTAAAQIFPAWSPDGKTIAYQQNDGATLTMDVATGKVSPLAPATFFPGRPAFAPNGKTIAIATVKPYSKRFREGTSSILSVDLATKKTQWFAPAPFESISTRTEDGPIYSPTGKEIAFIMDDLLYAMPVDADGHPAGTAVALNDETSDAPTYNGDGSKILYLNNGRLRLLDRATKSIASVVLDLTYTPFQPASTASTLIHVARFWKGTGADTQKNVDVLIAGNRVISVTPHGTVKIPAGARVIEAPNSTLLPGLWENHAHPNSDSSIYYGDRLGRLWMAYGITTLRDMADQAYRAAEQKEAFLSGAAVGPRLFATGEAIDGERTYYPMMIPTTSEAQLHREFERIRALDFDFMKLYVRLPYTWVVEGARFAHDKMGVQTAGHYLLPAVALGNDGMSHVSATARTGYAYSRSQTGTSYSDVRSLMEESGMWTISTLLNPGVIALMPELADDNRYNLAPPWERDRLMKAREAAIHSGDTGNEVRVMREESTVAGVMEKKGIFLGGTDSPLDLPSTSLHLNLIAQVKYGLAPWQALETVTSTAASAAGVAKDLGLIAPGYLADLILVEGAPLENIKDVTRVQCVMKNGVLQSTSKILAPFVRSSIGEAICASGRN